MSNQILLEEVEKQIKQAESNLQKATRDPQSYVFKQQMREWLHALHEKRRELLSRNNP